MSTLAYSTQCLPALCEACACLPAQALVDVCTLQDGIQFPDDLLAQVVELVFTAESCVQQGFFGVPFRQEDSHDTILEFEDRVSLWVPEVWYCLRLGC